MPGGVGYTSPNPYTNANMPPVTAPMDPYGDYWNKLSNNWRIKPQTYTSDFLSRYDKLMNLLGGYNKNVGQGTYGSDLLNETANQIMQSLTNPNESIAMGLARDRITGSGQAAKQQLADMLAGSNRRREYGTAMISRLNRDIAKQESESYRDIALQSGQEAVKNAMGMEEMRGGFFENAMRRELANRELGLNLAGTMSGGLGALADFLKSAGALQTGAQQTSFENLMGINQAELQRKQAQHQDMDRWIKENWAYNLPRYGSRPKSYGFGQSNYGNWGVK